MARPICRSCQRRLAERRDAFRERTGAALHARIGVNTGDVVVGNLGSRERFDYTVLGDAANLASRLEGANKAFGTPILVSETTWSRAAGHVRGREIARLQVVGRGTPVAVYELTGFPAEDAPAVLEDFERALSLYYAGRLDEALRAFEALGDDPVARAYAARCRALREDVPPDWDGVWRLTEK